jgi:hypothetical protein
MPPWHADPEFGHFSNDISLSPEQKAQLIHWIDAGAPRGDGPDPLAEVEHAGTDYPFDWPQELGEPDYILSIPNQSIPAHGHVNYRYIEVPTALPSGA